MKTVDENQDKAIKTLRNIVEAYKSTKKYIKITVIDDLVDYCGGKTIIAKPRDRCYETIGDNDLIEAISFELNNGVRKSLAGQWIENWEVVK